MTPNSNNNNTNSNLLLLLFTFIPIFVIGFSWAEVVTGLG